MLKKVKLYGELAEKYGKEWALDVSSPAEAFRALCANNRGMRQFIAGSEGRGMGYQIIVGKTYLDVRKELSDPTGIQDIKIVPIVLGSKSKWGTIIIGAIIMYLAWPYLAATGTEWAAMTSTEIAAQAAWSIGGAMVMGGVAALLAPTPDNPEDTEDIQNYSFGGAVNTTKQGFAVPVCYGQLMVGGAVISSGVTPEDYVP